MTSDPRLIAALDFPTADAAQQAVEEIGDAVAVSYTHPEPTRPGS